MEIDDPYSILSLARCAFVHDHQSFVCWPRRLSRRPQVCACRRNVYSPVRLNMQTTTIRVDVETHQKLVALSQRHHQPLGATVRLAADALDRDDLTARITAQLSRLHDDSSSWRVTLPRTNPSVPPMGSRTRESGKSGIGRGFVDDGFWRSVPQRAGAFPSSTGGWACAKIRSKIPQCFGGSDHHDVSGP